MSRGRGVGRVLCGGGDEIIRLSIDIRNGTCALEKHTSDDKLPLRGGEHAEETSARHRTFKHPCGWPA